MAAAEFSEHMALDEAGSFACFEDLLAIISEKGLCSCPVCPEEKYQPTWKSTLEYNLPPHSKYPYMYLVKVMKKNTQELSHERDSQIQRSKETGRNLVYMTQYILAMICSIMFLSSAAQY